MVSKSQRLSKYPSEIKVIFDKFLKLLTTTLDTVGGYVLSDGF
jgi:hypothetical protein